MELSGRKERLGQRGGCRNENAKEGERRGRREKEGPIVPLTYFTVISPLHSIRWIAAATKVASLCFDIGKTVMYGVCMHVGMYVRRLLGKTFG